MQSRTMAGEQRFVISARVIGAVHRDTPKLKMFMISVLWSDKTEVIVYRSFQDFKTFHSLLRKRFYLMNPFQIKNRPIPAFTAKALMSSLQKRASKQPVQHIKFLESYCDKLLKCEPSVTQSSEVTQFFMTKDHDLQSDFTKNSIIILLSENLPDGSVGGEGSGTHQNAGIVTHPFVTQTYRCVAAYETKDIKNHPFKVAVDEKLDVLIKDPAGWWLVEKDDKCLAWFPAPYLELWDEEEDDVDRFQLGATLYCAVRSYSAKNTDEVSVSIGSVVEVLKKSDNGWWLIRFNGKAGFIPSMYLQLYNNPRAGLFNLQRKVHSSNLNLATSCESSHPPSLYKENSPQLDSAGQSRRVPGRLFKAQSLDVLSETQPQKPIERDASTPDSRPRSMTNTSSEDSSSGISSSGDSFSSSKEQAQHLHRQGNINESGSSSPEFNLSDRRNSNISSLSSASATSKGSDTGSVAPVVPRRPKTEEILTRCTTLTRKAALATRTRLQIQPESCHSR